MKDQDFMKLVVGYYEAAEKDLQKQASVIGKYEAEVGLLFEKISEYVDSCVASGEIPGLVSDVIKLDLQRNPVKFVDLLMKKGTYSDLSFGQPSDYQTSVGKKDAVLQFCKL
jgi:hypothetical protein